MDDNKEFIKLNMLMNAINEVEEESQEEELDEESDFYAELKEAAWNILHENPDTDLENWKMMLIEQYPTEVVDRMGYDDGITDLCYTFRDWAEYFATERSVELYDLLVEAKREIKRLENVISSKL